MIRREYRHTDQKDWSLRGSVAAFPECYQLYLNSNRDKTSDYFAFGCLDELCLTEEKGAFDALKRFWDRHQDWLFGYLTYDLKNDVESLHSTQFDGLGFPVLHFVRPRLVFEISKEELLIWYDPDHDNPTSVQQVLARIRAFRAAESPPIHPIDLTPRESRSSYLAKLQTILKHIHRGDIYELNFCQEFYAENVLLEPCPVYEALNRCTKAPFSCYLQSGPYYLLSASPERFLRKQENRLISQPIKGTIRRGVTPAEDEILRNRLRNDPKERSENVMIVDLVRNDLSKTATKGSVKVEELFGIYSFETVHQMISTVTSELRPDVHFIDALKAAFPMGSMTGAPKIKAMELIGQYESTRRGLYSGAVGYFTPNGDFDFNVIIRSILYNALNGYLSVMAGGAITAASDPKKEYEESLLKAAAMKTTLLRKNENLATTCETTCTNSGSGSDTYQR